MERWSYKPEVEGLSPSLGTKVIGAGGETRTLDSSLEDSHVASYTTSANTYGTKRIMVHRTGFEPMFQRWQRRVLDQLDQRCKERKMVGMDRVELSPRVPKTRMLALHHTPKLVRQVRLELTLPCLRGRCLDPIWLLTHGGTERTRTVIGLVDNQVPHLSATVPLRLVLGADIFGWVEES